MQAIKVSQSVQIGSNILYGYFEELDSIGLTIILKMMAGIKADWEVGKSFEELDEIYNLANTIFSEEKFITCDGEFVMVIQAIVQCTSSLIADIEQPK
jgi:Na+/H+ antiporter NhaB